MTPDDDPRDPNVDAAYRATACEEPSPELDARILAAAHRAADARPAPVRRSFAQRWRVPVALAATVVLSVTVTLMVYESERAPQLSEPRGSGRIGEETVAPEAAGARRDAEKNAAQRELLELRKRSPAPSSDESTTRTPAPFPAEPAVRPAAPPAAAAAREKDRQERAAPSINRERALADRPAARSERDAAIGAAKLGPQTAEEWLAEIRALKAAGRIDEANRLLAEFRERYADFPLPEDLR